MRRQNVRKKVFNKSIINKKWILSFNAKKNAKVSRQSHFRMAEVMISLLANAFVILVINKNVRKT